MIRVSILATLVAAAAGFALGGIWYGPLFAKAWMEEHGFKAEELIQGFNPARTYGLMFLLSLIAAYFFGVFIGPNPRLDSAVLWGATVGVVWVAASIGTNYLFERKSMRLFLINGGYHAVRFILIGLAFGLLG